MDVVSSAMFGKCTYLITFRERKFCVYKEVNNIKIGTIREICPKPTIKLTLLITLNKFHTLVLVFLLFT